jgi:hypothetical protein
MPLNSEKLPVDTTIAMNAAAVAVSRKSEIAMPLYSPVPTHYTSSSFAPALSIAFLIAASRPDAFSFKKPLVPSVLYLNRDKYRGIFPSLACNPRNYTALCSMEQSLKQAP